MERDPDDRDLFSNFNPRNPVEADMVHRYAKWHGLYHDAATVVDREGATTTHPNGTISTSRHFMVMQAAEGEMRRLWKQLSPIMADRRSDDDGMGQFADL